MLHCSHVRRVVFSVVVEPLVVSQYVVVAVVVAAVVAGRGRPKSNGGNGLLLICVNHCRTIRGPVITFCLADPA